MSMSTLRPPSIDPVMAGGVAVPVVIPYSFSHFLMPINARGITYQLDAPLIEEPTIAADRLVTKFAIDEHVIFILTLFGEQVEDGFGFRAKTYLLHSKVTEPRARGHFVASTVLAVLGFAGSIGLKIPDLGIQTSLDFKPPLAQIGDFIRRRDIAYKLLVLERTTGKDFGWPEMYTLEEFGQLTRIKRAIVERAFIGPVDPEVLRVPADREVLAWVESFEQSPRQVFGPVELSSKIFNQVIPLGDVKIVVDDAYIVNAEQVCREVSAGDGREVEVIVSSRSGVGLYETPEAPRLPDSPWDAKIEVLASLEKALDEELIERYNTLAAATLSGTNEEERAFMTARPELDVDAFLTEE
jgi:hypothetical protein